MNTRIDTQAVKWREGTGAELIVALHGYGSDEADLFAIAPHVPPQFTFASLPAPHASPHGGRSWFEFNPAVDSTDHTMIDDSSRAVLERLDGLDRAFARVHLFGFSQGGAMAVQLTRLAPERFASVLHLSSFVHNGDLPGDPLLAAREPRLPLFQAIGAYDDVIAADKRERSIPWLDEHFDVERRRYERGHSIEATELADAVAFLQRL